MKAWLDVFQFVFGYRHRHLSRVFTIKPRTYKVCFDCGRFDLPDAQEPKRSDAAPSVLLETIPRHVHWYSPWFARHTGRGFSCELSYSDA